MIHAVHRFRNSEQLALPREELKLDKRIVPAFRASACVADRAMDRLREEDPAMVAKRAEIRAGEQRHVASLGELLRLEERGELVKHVSSRSGYAVRCGEGNGGRHPSLPRLCDSAQFLDQSSQERAACGWREHVSGASAPFAG